MFYGFLEDVTARRCLVVFPGLMPRSRLLRLPSLENGGSPMSSQRFSFNAPRLGALAVEAIREPLLDLADRCNATELVFDLRCVGFLDAAALGLFVVLNKKLRARGGRLAIRGVHPWLMELFEVTHLDKVLDLRQRPESSPLPWGTCRVVGKGAALVPTGG
jgi:anti-anti-sigma factor